jgi:hypothetical protein
MRKGRNNYRKLHIRHFPCNHASNPSYNGASTGGAEEKLRSPALLLVQVGVFFGGGARGAPWWRTCLPCTRESEDSCRALCPGQILRRRIWVKNKMEAAVHGDRVDGGGGAGRRLYGAEWRRLPVRTGVSPDPRLWGVRAAARRRDVLVSVSVAGVQKDQFVISFWFLDCSVRTAV